MPICEFCKKEYSTKGNLLKHQQVTKKCVSLQLKTKKYTPVVHKCTYCEYTTPQKKMLNAHSIKCADTTIKYYKHLYELTLDKLNVLQLELKNKQIMFIEHEYNEVKQQLKENVQVLLAKPCIINHSNSSTINKVELVLNLNNDVIHQKVDDYFTLTHLSDGIKGVAKFTNDFIINKENGQSKYICTDVARTIFKYKDDNNQLQKDVKATKLKNSIKEPIIIKSKRLYDVETERLLNEMTINTNGDNVAIHNFNLNQLTDNFLKVKHIEDYGDEYAKEMILMLNSS